MATGFINENTFTQTRLVSEINSEIVNAFDGKDVLNNLDGILLLCGSKSFGEIGQASMVS